MAIKAVFPDGVKTISVDGLFQWDYGQVLEIEAADIGTEIMEVHFACSNMNEAIVRSCSFSDGVGMVTIPNQCLEQSRPITAWLFRIDGTQGHTEKIITLPITARTRPSGTRDIPQDVVDKYAELITEVNEVVGKLASGDVVVAKAASATSAGYATNAGNAASATHATSATRSEYATAAVNAVCDGNKDEIKLTYLKRGKDYKLLNGASLAGGIISFRITASSENAGTDVANVIVDVYQKCSSPMFPLYFYNSSSGTLDTVFCCLRFTEDENSSGCYFVNLHVLGDTAGNLQNNEISISYKYLSVDYNTGTATVEEEV